MKLGLKSTLAQALVLVLISVGLALAGNQLSPRGLPLIPPPKPVAPASEFISLDQAKKAWHRGTVLFLDAREPDDFAAGHIGNALNLPAQSFAEHFGAVAPILTPDTELILYCDGPKCDLSHRLAASLRPLGYTNLNILSNGWAVWRQAGLPATMGGKQ